MRWKRARRSENVEDRRGMTPAKGAAAVGGGGILIMLIAMLFGVDPSALVGLTGGGGGAAQAQTREINPEHAELAEFTKVILASTEDVWNRLFREQGRTYQEPVLVMFSDSVQSACGHATAAVGPFYCPGDHKAYIDLSFYETMKSRLGAPGDAAQAYVIAHEVGHHIQKLLGFSDIVRKKQRGLSKAEANQWTVRLELQADYFAGVWAHHAPQVSPGVSFERGDLEEILNAANAIGDDTLQKRSQGYVVPDAFTHGTAEQRMRWFKKGLRSGDMGDSDTFTIPYSSL